MELRKELDKWIKAETKYITKFYMIRNYSEKENLELFYKYEKDEEVIERKEYLGIELKSNFSKVDLDHFLDDSNDKFHLLLAEHIEENWEQKIFTYNPDHNDLFDIAYYPMSLENTPEDFKRKGKVIITQGKRVGDQILSTDEKINLEEKKEHLSFIGWCHE